MSDIKNILQELATFTEDHRQQALPLIAEALAEAEAKEQKARSLRSMPKSQRPLCGAKTRAGGTCQARALHGSERCRRHGGRASTLTAAYRRHLREEAAHLRMLVRVCRALLW